MQGELRCEHCRDVIGVYEPVVTMIDGEPLRTSRAVALGHLRGAPCFHEGCFKRSRSTGEEPDGAGSVA
ncbi:MAG TPA: hypothetical protein VL988_04900 [Solirubrobacteraceae bacterium]|nr:hypothetical protein [Solirubrobacteraceae bacterium]HUA74078.1 hypothetical protein [Solirubrobacteraceae bacterium]